MSDTPRTDAMIEELQAPIGGLKSGADEALIAFARSLERRLAAYREAAITLCASVSDEEDAAAREAFEKLLEDEPLPPDDEETESPFTGDGRG